jgi:hypothetical protein
MKKRQSGPPVSALHSPCGSSSSRSSGYGHAVGSAVLDDLHCVRFRWGVPGSGETRDRCQLAPRNHKLLRAAHESHCFTTRRSLLLSCRYFGALFSRLREPNRDRLLPAFHLLARTATFQRPLLPFTHCFLYLLGCLLSIPCHCDLPVLSVSTCALALATQCRPCRRLDGEQSYNSRRIMNRQSVQY